ncbi:MAG: cytochrome c-type biogenesis protein CcmH, partial [Pseudomonadota bacterium]
RYGEFVLLRPPFGLHTLLLWLAPLLLLGGAIFLARRVSMRGRGMMAAFKAQSLSPEEKGRLAKLLDENKNDR